MIGSMVPIIMIDMSLSAPVMIIIGSAIRAQVSAKLAHSAGHPPMMIPQLFCVLESPDVEKYPVTLAPSIPSAVPAVIMGRDQHGCVNPIVAAGEANRWGLRLQTVELASDTLVRSE
jgi:hypothetical protein